MAYALARKLLFRLSPEKAHDLSLKALKAAEKASVLPLLLPAVEKQPVTVMGLSFPNPVGLAAGLDKNGDYIDGLARLGFGFLELGTVTPRAQPGNPQPRLFRLSDNAALINRMGFNNHGVDHLVSQLQRTRYTGILGINVGKNKDTPASRSEEDYVTCIEKVFPYASYITINISSPNTPGLRSLQFGDSLKSLLNNVKECQQRLQTQHQRRVPIVVKIAPDMSDEEINLVAETLVNSTMDGVIATNTTLSRVGVEGTEFSKEKGGLSGQPLTERSLHVIRVLNDVINQQMPIIASGGVMSGEDAAARIKAGASLVQLYTGLIYRGPKLIGDAVGEIKQSLVHSE